MTDITQEQYEDALAAFQSPEERAKDAKLEHYATRDLTKFVQYDGFIMDYDDDFVLVPDEEGHCIMAGETQELMTGNYSVRVLITEGTDKEQVVALLKKILATIEDGAYPNIF